MKMQKSLEICSRCDLPVYQAERRAAIGKVWHEFCFNCVICRRLLTPSSLKPHKGELYCASCYQEANEAFLLRNKYSDESESLVKSHEWTKNRSLKCNHNKRCKHKRYSEEETAEEEEVLCKYTKNDSKNVYKNVRKGGYYQTRRKSPKKIRTHKQAYEHVHRHPKSSKRITRQDNIHRNRKQNRHQVSNEDDYEDEDDKEDELWQTAERKTQGRRQRVYEEVCKLPKAEFSRKVTRYSVSDDGDEEERYHNPEKKKQSRLNEDEFMEYQYLEKNPARCNNKSKYLDRSDQTDRYSKEKFTKHKITNEKNIPRRKVYKRDSIIEELTEKSSKYLVENNEKEMQQKIRKKIPRQKMTLANHLQVKCPKKDNKFYPGLTPHPEGTIIYKKPKKDVNVATSTNKISRKQVTYNPCTVVSVYTVSTHTNDSKKKCKNEKNNDTSRQTKMTISPCMFYCSPHDSKSRKHYTQRETIDLNASFSSINLTVLTPTKRKPKRKTCRKTTNEDLEFQKSNKKLLKNEELIYDDAFCTAKVTNFPKKRGHINKEVYFTTTEESCKNDVKSKPVERTISGDLIFRTSQGNCPKNKCPKTEDTLQTAIAIFPERKKSVDKKVSCTSIGEKCKKDPKRSMDRPLSGDLLFRTSCGKCSKNITTDRDKYEIGITKTSKRRQSCDKICPPLPCKTFRKDVRHRSLERMENENVGVHTSCRKTPIHKSTSTDKEMYQIAVTKVPKNRDSIENKNVACQYTQKIVSKNRSIDKIPNKNLEHCGRSVNKSTSFDKEICEIALLKKSPKRRESVESNRNITKHTTLKKPVNRALDYQPLSGKHPAHKSTSINEEMYQIAVSKSPKRESYREDSYLTGVGKPRKDVTPRRKSLDKSGTKDSDILESCRKYPTSKKYVINDNVYQTTILKSPKVSESVVKRIYYTVTNESSKKDISSRSRPDTCSNEEAKRKNSADVKMCYKAVNKPSRQDIRQRASIDEEMYQIAISKSPKRGELAGEELYCTAVGKSKREPRRSVERKESKEFQSCGKYPVHKSTSIDDEIYEIAISKSSKKKEPNRKELYCTTSEKSRKDSRCRSVERTPSGNLEIQIPCGTYPVHKSTSIDEEMYQIAVSKTNKKKDSFDDKICCKSLGESYRKSSRSRSLDRTGNESTEFKTPCKKYPVNKSTSIDDTMYQIEISKTPKREQPSEELFCTNLGTSRRDPKRRSLDRRDSGNLNKRIIKSSMDDKMFEIAISKTPKNKIPFDDDSYCAAMDKSRKEMKHKSLDRVIRERLEFSTPCRKNPVDRSTSIDEDICQLALSKSPKRRVSIDTRESSKTLTRNKSSGGIPEDFDFQIPCRKCPVDKSTSIDKEIYQIEISKSPKTKNDEKGWCSNEDQISRKVSRCRSSDRSINRNSDFEIFYGRQPVNKSTSIDEEELFQIAFLKSPRRRVSIDIGEAPKRITRSKSSDDTVQIPCRKCRLDKTTSIDEDMYEIEISKTPRRRESAEGAMWCSAMQSSSRNISRCRSSDRSVNRPSDFQIPCGRYPLYRTTSDGEEMFQIAISKSPKKGEPFSEELYYTATGTSSRRQPRRRSVDKSMNVNLDRQISCEKYPVNRKMSIDIETRPPPRRRVSVDERTYTSDDKSQECASEDRCLERNDDMDSVFQILNEKFPKQKCSFADGEAYKATVTKSVLKKGSSERMGTRYEYLERTDSYKYPKHKKNCMDRDMYYTGIENSPRIESRRNCLKRNDGDLIFERQQDNEDCRIVRQILSPRREQLYQSNNSPSPKKFSIQETILEDEEYQTPIVKKNSFPNLEKSKKLSQKKQKIFDKTREKYLLNYDDIFPLGIFGKSLKEFKKDNSDETSERIYEGSRYVKGVREKTPGGQILSIDEEFYETARPSLVRCSRASCNNYYKRIKYLPLKKRSEDHEIPASSSKENNRYVRAVSVPRKKVSAKNRCYEYEDLLDSVPEIPIPRRISSQSIRSKEVYQTCKPLTEIKTLMKKPKREDETKQVYTAKTFQQMTLLCKHQHCQTMCLGNKNNSLFEKKPNVGEEYLPPAVKNLGRRRRRYSDENIQNEDKEFCVLPVKNAANRFNINEDKNQKGVSNILNESSDLYYTSNEKSPIVRTTVKKSKSSKEEENEEERRCVITAKISPRTNPLGKSNKSCTEKEVEDDREENSNQEVNNTGKLDNKDENEKRGNGKREKQEEKQVVKKKSKAELKAGSLKEYRSSKAPVGVSSFCGQKHDIDLKFGESCFSLQSNISEEICKRCDEKVFIVERLIAGGGVYHDSCFSCLLCRRHLDSLSLVERRGEIFCIKCHMKLFGPLIYGYGLKSNLPCLVNTGL